MEYEFNLYKNVMIGEETLANKGFLALRLQVDGKYFISVYNTHLHAGGALLKMKSTKYCGTTSERRGQQMGLL